MVLRGDKHPYQSEDHKSYGYRLTGVFLICSWLPCTVVCSALLCTVLCSALLCPVLCSALLLCTVVCSALPFTVVCSELLCFVLCCALFCITQCFAYLSLLHYSALCTQNCIALYSDRLQCFVLWQHCIALYSDRTALLCTLAALHCFVLSAVTTIVQCWRHCPGRGVSLSNCTVLTSRCGRWTVQ